ncbi:uncharacterized protein LOC135826565 [Sycon ciliatum]|uniref:uncharacterized protein LOC135804735 n=1 Tax=Sycon ciliatum TaxID=27933 RepID=UPI0031F64108
MTMVQCFAAECNHRTEDRKCSFFRFPARDPERREIWRKMCRRQDKEPDASSRLCSCHFKDGDKKKDPTIFPRNKDKAFGFQDPEPMHRRKRTVKALAVDDTDKDGSEPTEADPFEAEREAAEREAAEREATTMQRLLELFQRIDTSILEVKYDKLKAEVSALEKRKAKVEIQFCFEFISRKAELVRHYTGLPSADDFRILFRLCTRFPIEYHQGWRVELVPMEDQLLITLMKLRCNFSLTDLGLRFGTSHTTISNIFHTWLSVLHTVLYQGMLPSQLPSVTKNKTSLPVCFSTFSSCRLILDCTEVEIAIPSRMDTQTWTYSHYKHKNTFKGLVGVAPNGVVNYVSPLYPGSTSDKEVVRHCGVLSKLTAGDMVLADKGFLIHDLMPAGVSLNLPPFLTTPQFTAAQANVTARIARARIHVERAIQRIKIFAILDYIPYQYRSFSSEIFQVCAMLTNLCNPLLKEIEAGDLSADPASETSEHTDISTLTPLQTPAATPSQKLPITPDMVNQLFAVLSAADPLAKAPAPSASAAAPSAKVQSASATVQSASAAAPSASAAAAVPSASAAAAAPSASAITPDMVNQLFAVLSAADPLATAAAPSASAAAAVPSASGATAAPSAAAAARSASAAAPSAAAAAPAASAAAPSAAAAAPSASAAAPSAAAAAPSASAAAAVSRVSLDTLHYLPHDMCQSRMDGRQWSNACTIIACLQAWKYLTVPYPIQPLSSAEVTKRFVNSMREGNRLYDDAKLGNNLLAIYDALDVIPGKPLRVAPRSDFGARNEEGLSKLLKKCKDQAILSQSVLPASLIQNPYTILLVFFPSGYAQVFDSHAHGERGALIAILPADMKVAANFLSTLVGHIKDSHLCILARKQ